VGLKVVKKQILLGMLGAALGICTAATVFAQSGFYGGVSMRDHGAESGGLMLGDQPLAWSRFTAPVFDDADQRSLVFGGYRWKNDLAVEAAFNTADKYALRAVARERLSKIAGIVLANPDLHLVAEGHTDSIGTEAHNQQLSEQRAGSVRDYLVKQGIPSASVASHGFGKTQPVASNDNAAGRQQNRRVELVVTGDAIGKGPVVISGGQN